MRLSPVPRTSTTSRSGPRGSRWAAFLTALLTVGLLVGVVPGPGGQAARANGKPAGTPRQAADRAPSFATYNMEGSNRGQRWTGEAGPLTEQHEVLALQEVGSGPPTDAHGTQPESIPIPMDVTRPAGLPRSVNHSRWQYGRSTDDGGRPPRHVYYLQTDPQHSSTTGRDAWIGGRVNLAIVTAEQADEIRVIENPMYNPSETNNAYRLRRALGVRIGNTVYYNVHARGADVGGLLRGIRDATRPGERWVMLGDFNLDIRYRSDEQARNQSLHLRVGEQLVRPNRATHQNGGELDYAITYGMPRYTAGVPSGRGADHYPVQFAPHPAPVTPAPARATHTFSSAFENARTGWVMSVTNDGRVISGSDRFDDRQRFRMGTVEGHWYRFNYGDSPPGASATRGVLADRAARPRGCPGLNPWLPLQVLLLPCDSKYAQWQPESPEEPDGTLIWRNSARPELCLTGTPMLERVLALPCDGSQAQRWWDNSRAVEEKTWEPGESKTRLRASSGLYLSARDGGKSDETELTTYSHGDTSRWDIQYAGPGDNIARIKGIDSGKCVDVLDSDDSGIGTTSVLGDCGTGNSRNDGTGRRWLVETYVDGSVRLRNEANHLCLVAPLRETEDVTVDECGTEARQRWTIAP